MKGSIKLFSVIFVISLILIPFSSAMATGDIIDALGAYGVGTCYLDSSEGQYIITFADLDGDNNTGAWINGRWYPNELQIVLRPLNGAPSVNCNGDGQIKFINGSSDFAILFVNATAPGWVWNRPETWSPKRIRRAQLQMIRGTRTNDSIPCMKALAYDYWKHPITIPTTPCIPIPEMPWLCLPLYTPDLYTPSTPSPRIVAKVVLTDLSPNTPMSVYTLQNYNGFSEIYIHTDYSDSKISSLCLFDTYVFYFSL